MTASWTLRRPVHHIGAFDVVVVGAGCAGCVAAIAAARSGARTLLVERDGSLGGTSTAVLDTFYGFYAPGERPVRVVGGVPFEIAHALVARGDAFERPNTYGAGTGVTYNQQVLRALWDERCRRDGVQVVLHAALTDIVGGGDDGNELLVTSGTELLRVSASVVVDASGDGVVAHLLGASSEGFTDIANPQSLSVTFTMAPVDDGAVARLGRDGLLELLRRARDSGRYDLPRTDGSLHAIAPGVQFLHMTRVVDRDPRDPVALSEAEMDGRAQALEYARFFRERVPGFDGAGVVWMAPRAGIRESRRVRGRYWLTRDDVVTARRFDDAVAQGAAPIEVHGQGHDTRWEFLGEGRVYDIPYRSLLPAELAGVLVAGRCFSASHDAHASARNMAQCMAMGQAAGTAAALAVDVAAPPHEIDHRQLQKVLRDDGALFGGETA